MMYLLTMYETLEHATSRIQPLNKLGYLEFKIYKGDYHWVLEAKS